MSNPTSIRESFKQDGFVVVRRIFQDDEIERYKTRLKDLAGDKQQKWTWPDGVNQNREFWDIIFNEKILQTLREIFGEKVRYLSHNDLHVGFSSLTWHRDSVNRDFGIGPDWDESEEPYELARVGVYLQQSQSQFKLGLIKGSHRPDKYMTAEERRQIHAKTKGLSNVISVLFKRDPLRHRAEWIATEPGDCIIFDPRALHTGSDFQDVKYSTFTAYGVPNRHFYNHAHYYRHLRQDLNYQDLHPDLVKRLQEAGLYAEERPPEGKIQGAWIPSAAFTAVAKRFK